MQKLIAYINALPMDERPSFESGAGTTIAYIRKACSAGQRLGETICIDIERHTNGAVRCEDIRPDLADRWAYLRGTDCNDKEVA